MVRLVLLLVLFVFIARTFWRIVDNIIEAAGGKPPRGPASPRNVTAAKMTRDPICGTFVLPERSIWLADGSARVYFCSEACRDKYRQTHRSKSA